MVELPEELFNSNDEHKIVKELFEEKGIDLKTDLTRTEIAEICKLMHIYDKFKIPAIRKFIERFKVLNVSKNRKGRGEFIQALRSERDLSTNKEMKDLERMMR